MINTFAIVPKKVGRNLYGFDTLLSEPQGFGPTNSLERGGFEPPKAEPADLQSAPFDRSGTSPSRIQVFNKRIIIFLASKIFGCFEGGQKTDLQLGAARV
jgi:hypothetical protein